LGEGDDAFAASDRGEMLVLLRGAAGLSNGASADHHGGYIGLDHQRLAELFHDQGDIDRPAAKAAELLRQRRGQQPKLGECRPIPLPAVLAFQRFAALVEIVLAGRPFRDRVTKHVLLVSVIEVHAGVPC
jgi:hypothetical protein